MVMENKVVLDLFCGRLGWSREFAKRGWHCIGVDLTKPPEVPDGCEILLFDILHLGAGPGFVFHANEALHWSVRPDAIVASPSCEEFSVHGMKHFHPHPKYPTNGIRMFEHTRALCESSGLPYVIENVRSAQQFVGNAVHHCGPFYLWGNAVPPLMHSGITKGTHDIRGVPINRSRRFYFDKKAGKNRLVTERAMWKETSSGSKECKKATAELATIPPELANCVAEYMERIIETRCKASA